MADNELENVRIMVKDNKYSPSQLGIDLIQQSSYLESNDPIIEAVDERADRDRDKHLHQQPRHAG